MDDQPTFGEEPTRRIDADPTRVMPASSVPPPSGGQSSEPSAGVGGGPSPTTLVFAALGAAVAGLVIGAVAIGGDNEKTVTQTVTLSKTQTVTVTSQPTATATTPTDAPTGAVSAEAAKSAAQAAASETAFEAGISITPDDIDAQCTPQGGAATSDRWSCDVASQSGQCTGTLSVVAADQGETAIENNGVSCGE